jgi:hypothetical protein
MTVTLADLRPGDVIFPTIHGYAGALVGAGQFILGDATSGEWKVRHVAMVAQAQTPPNQYGTRIVQAMPSGAEEIDLTRASFADGFPILRPDWSLITDRPVPIAGGGVAVAISARRYIGVPYSFADYAAIAGRHVLALQPTQRTPFDRYVSNSHRMICSQLVDQALTDAGYHLFDDGRIPQDVTPAALYRKLLTMPGTVRLR